MGALDFAGGTVVHINAGIAGFVGCLFLGKRIGYPHDIEPPHSITMTMIGASLLWVGWFGFNAGSNLELTGMAALAFVNTMVATAAAALGWMFTEWVFKGKPSLLGMVSGAVAGLVAVTPASGFAGPMGSIVLGFVAGAACFSMCAYVKQIFGYDDALDVFGVHCIGGIIGAIGTGILVAPYLGGTGLTDYINQTWLRLARGLRHGGTGLDPDEERAFHAFLVGYRFGDPLQVRRPHHRPQGDEAGRTRRPRHCRSRRAGL